MKLPTNLLFWFIIVILVGSSSFFTYRIITFKMSLRGGEVAEDIQSGITVSLVKVIDGDEISVTYGDENFVVRIMGIKSFDPTVNDPVVAGIAQQSLDFLINNLSDKSFSLVFNEFKRDSQMRLLSYVEIDGRDIGLEMIRNGMTLVYTKYPFQRMEQYLVVEDIARRSKTGLWGNELITERADKLKITWEAD